MFEPVVPTAFAWSNPTGGAFSDAENWDPAQTPTLDDEVLFNLPVTYTVEIDESTTIGKFAATGGTVALDFDGTNLTGTDLTVGGDGQAASLTLRGAEEPIVSSISAPSDITRQETTTSLDPAESETSETAMPVGNVQWQNVFVLDQGVLQVISDRPLGTQVLLVDDKAVVEGELKILKGGTMTTEKLFVGDDGRDGTLIVQSADPAAPAMLSSGEAVLGDAQNFGVIAGGKGVAQIDGHAKADLDSLVIGDGGEGEFFVSSGAILEILTDVTLGKNVGASGDLDIDGVGTAVAVGGNLTIGNTAALAGAFDRSQVFVRNDATMLVLGNTSIGIDGLLLAGGSAASDSTVRLGGNLTLHEDALGVVVERGASLLFISTGTSEVTVGYGSQLTIRRDSSQNTVTDPAVVSTVRADNGGELNIQIGTTPDLLGGSPAAAVLVEAGGLLQMTEIAVGRLLVGGDLIVDGGGVTGRTIMVNRMGDATVSNGGFVVLGSTLFVDGVLLEVAQGTRNVADEVIVGSGGLLQIDGNFQSPNTIIQDGGQVQTGSSPGRGSIVGDLLIDEGGEWIVEIAGTTPDTEYDQLFITGDAVINGTIVFDFIDGFLPTAGQVFDFLHGTGAADLSDASFRFEGLLPGFEFAIGSFDGGLRFTALTDGIAVPEPGTALLVALCAAGLILPRRALRGIFPSSP